jgi:hypothetical protein
LLLVGVGVVMEGQGVEVLVVFVQAQDFLLRLELLIRLPLVLVAQQK